MPNWCENELRVDGKARDVLTFFEAMKGFPPNYAPHPVHSEMTTCKLPSEPVYTFNAIVPVPEDTEKVGYDGGYRIERLEELLLNTEARAVCGEISNFYFNFSRVYSDERRKKMDVAYEKIVNLIKAFKIQNKEEILDLFKNIKEVQDGFRWQISNWGTKWEPRMEIETHHDELKIMDDLDVPVSIEMDFLSPWSSPIEFFIKAGELFPSLAFTLLYGEVGNDFSGRLEIEAGEVITSLQGQYGKHQGERDWDYDEDDE